MTLPSDLVLEEAFVALKLSQVEILASLSSEQRRCEFTKLIITRSVYQEPGRSIREVIQQIIPLIPVDTPNPDDDFTELKGELEKFTGSWFAAPEVEMPLWIGLATTLEEWFGEPKGSWPDWKWEVLAIFSGTKGGAIETPNSITDTPTTQD